MKAVAAIAASGAEDASVWAAAGLPRVLLAH
jgi:hypothetical protein